MLVQLTTDDLARLVEAAAARGARLVANELQDPLLTTRELAERLGVAPSTINQWVADGDLRPERRATSGGRGKSHKIRLGEGLRCLRARHPNYAKTTSSR